MLLLLPRHRREFNQVLFHMNFFHSLCGTAIHFHLIFLALNFRYRFDCKNKINEHNWFTWTKDVDVCTVLLKEFYIIQNLCSTSHDSSESLWKIKNNLVQVSSTNSCPRKRGCQNFQIRRTSEMRTKFSRRFRHK